MTLTRGMQNEIIKAPSAISPTSAAFDGTHAGVATGAWYTRMLGRKIWQTMFAGTHQSVPFHTTGRTPGRSLRTMRRVLSREAIPANV